MKPFTLNSRARGLAAGEAAYLRTTLLLLLGLVLAGYALIFGLLAFTGEGVGERPALLLIVLFFSLVYGLSALFSLEGSGRREERTELWLALPVGDGERRGARLLGDLTAVAGFAVAAAGGLAPLWLLGMEEPLVLLPGMTGGFALTGALLGFFLDRVRIGENHVWILGLLPLFVLYAFLSDEADPAELLLHELPTGLLLLAAGIAGLVLRRIVEPAEQLRREREGGPP